MSYAIGLQNNHGTSEAGALFIGRSVLIQHDPRAADWMHKGPRWLEDRDNTQQPDTGMLSTKLLIGTDPTALVPALETLFAGKWKKGSIPPLWDGKAGGRTIAQIESLLG